MRDEELKNPQCVKCTEKKAHHQADNEFWYCDVCYIAYLEKEYERLKRENEQLKSESRKDAVMMADAGGEMNRLRDKIENLKREHERLKELSTSMLREFNRIRDYAGGIEASVEGSIHKYGHVVEEIEEEVSE